MAGVNPEEAGLFLRARMISGDEILNYEPVMLGVELPLDVVKAIATAPFTGELSYDICRAIRVACRKTLLIVDDAA